jgi:hypothetical protein
VPDVRDLTPVDLRTVSYVMPAGQPVDGDLLAESRFLLSAEARASKADFVGMCSANYDLKWPAPPHLVDLPRLGRQLQPSQALGEELVGLDQWMASAERNHPGMVDILDRLTRRFALELHDHRVPGANTFICHRDAFNDLLDTFAALFNAVLEWYGPAIPFRYRCPDCGSVSDTGYGRWTNARHIGYLGERITRLIFSSRPDIDFSTPAEFEASARGRSLRRRLHRKARPVRQRRSDSGGAVSEPWHRATHGLGETRPALTVCPVCAERGRQR